MHITHNPVKRSLALTVKHDSGVTAGSELNVVTISLLLPQFHFQLCTHRHTHIHMSVSSPSKWHTQSGFRFH